MKKIFFSGLVSGLVMAIVGALLSMLWTTVFPWLAVEYANGLFRPWSDPLMSLIFVVPVISGFVMAAIWQAHKTVLQKKWWNFATVLSVLSILGMIMTYSCFPISFLMLMTWCVSMIIQYLLGTWILMKMNR